MISKRLNRINSILSDLKTHDLWRVRRVLSSAQAPQVTLDGVARLSFGSNDYLGLCHHPAVLAAAQEALASYGLGAGASPLLSGHHIVHAQLEDRLATQVGMPRALLCNSGFAANLAILTTMFSSNDLVISDALNHASLIDGIRLSKAQCQVVSHLDVTEIGRILKAHSQEAPNAQCAVVTDGVFSMDGDIAPIADLFDLCLEYDAWLIVDDAHGFGVLGARGEGVLSHLINHPDYDQIAQHIIYMGTLGKALGAHGAFIAAADEVIELLLQKARSYVFSTASPPSLSHAILAGLDLVQSGERQKMLLHNIEFFKERLQLEVWRCLESVTAIQPILIGESQQALAAMQLLEVHGIWVPAIRYPTVPTSMARLRVSLSAKHTREDIDRLCVALATVEKQLNVESTSS